MKRILLLLVLLAVGAGVAWYIVTPRSTVEDLRTAARAGDTDALDARVDYDSVRANLKSDLREHLARVAEREQPLATLGAAIGTVFLEGMIDTFVSPAGLSLLMMGHMPDADPPSSADTRIAAEYEIERHGPNRFTARFEPADPDGVHPTLNFRRDGLEWRLVRVGIRQRED